MDSVDRRHVLKVPVDRCEEPQEFTKPAPMTEMEFANFLEQIQQRPEQVSFEPPTFADNAASRVIDLNSTENKPYIKKPPNAFMLFRAANRQRVVDEIHITDCAQVNRELGRRWKMLSEEEQAPYFEQALRERRAHKAMFPGWTAKENYCKRVKERNAPSHHHFGFPAPANQQPVMGPYATGPMTYPPQAPYNLDPYNQAWGPHGQASYNQAWDPHGQTPYNQAWDPHGQTPYNQAWDPHGQTPYNQAWGPHDQAPYNQAWFPNIQDPDNKAWCPNIQAPDNKALCSNIQDPDNKAWDPSSQALDNQPPAP